MKRMQALTIVPVDGTRVAEHRATTVAPPVKEGIQDLLVAYPPHPGEEGVDRVRLARIWARETAAFEEEIVIEAFHNLLVNNPRNPFRPSVQDIVSRCRRVQEQWAQRAMDYYAGKVDCPPPAWCVGIAEEALRAKLAELVRWNVKETPKPYAAMTDAEQRGWQLAQAIGRSLSRWPLDLLLGFGVLTGPDLDRVQAMVDAEHARREREWAEQREQEAAAACERDRFDRIRAEAQCAALTRALVKAALEATEAARACAGIRSTAAQRAHEAFVDLYRPALCEELKARGLQP